MNDINENAKVDWMNLVKKHKKKQKGLPALSTLNTNAGNVEKNIEMFNNMQPDGSVSVDAVNGNVTSSEGCCESLEESSTQTQPLILSYSDLPIEVVTRRGNPSVYYDRGMEQWYPDEDETEEINVDWEYEITPEQAVEALQEIDEVLIYLSVDYDINDDVLHKIIEKHVQELVEEFEDDLKDIFYDDAVSDAEENYEYYDEDPFWESVTKDKDLVKGLDDKFDMSMRTLL